MITMIPIFYSFISDSTQLMKSNWPFVVYTKYTTCTTQAAAVAARSGTKAAAFAENHGITASYGSYDELLADPSIDVVYVGSIADEHARLAAKALVAGKPTVVEKPLTLSLGETAKLIDLAKKTDTFLMQVYHQVDKKNNSSMKSLPNELQYA